MDKRFLLLATLIGLNFGYIMFHLPVLLTFQASLNDCTHQATEAGCLASPRHECIWLEPQQKCVFTDYQTVNCSSFNNSLNSIACLLKVEQCEYLFHTKECTHRSGFTPAHRGGFAASAVSGGIFGPFLLEKMWRYFSSSVPTLLLAISLSSILAATLFSAGVESGELGLWCVAKIFGSVCSFAAAALFPGMLAHENVDPVDRPMLVRLMGVVIGLSAILMAVYLYVDTPRATMYEQDPHFKTRLHSFNAVQYFISAGFFIFAAMLWWQREEDELENNRKQQLEHEEEEEERRRKELHSDVDEELARASVERNKSNNDHRVVGPPAAVTAAGAVNEANEPINNNDNHNSASTTATTAATDSAAVVADKGNDNNNNPDEDNSPGSTQVPKCSTPTPPAVSPPAQYIVITPQTKKEKMDFPITSINSGNSDTTTPAATSLTLRQQQQQLQQQEHDAQRFAQKMRDETPDRMCLLYAQAVFLPFQQQLNGLSALASFLPIILEQTIDDPLLAQLVFASGLPIGSLASFLVFGYLLKWPPLRVHEICAFGCSFAALLIGLALMPGTSISDSTQHSLALGGVAIFSFFFGAVLIHSFDSEA